MKPIVLALVSLSLLSACSSGTHSTPADAGADLSAEQDLLMPDLAAPKPPPHDLWAGDLAGTGCATFVACYIACFNDNPATATAVGCKMLCGVSARTGTGTKFDTALTCGQDFCLGAAGDAGLSRCKLVGSQLVNLDGSAISTADPVDGSDPQKACGACLNNTLARLFADTCTVMSSPDCNPPSCASATDACINDL
jgi:hypothetical protein